MLNILIHFFFVKQTIGPACTLGRESSLVGNQITMRELWKFNQW